MIIPDDYKLKPGDLLINKHNNGELLVGRVWWDNIYHVTKFSYWDNINKWEGSGCTFLPNAWRTYGWEVIPKQYESKEIDYSEI